MCLQSDFAPIIFNTPKEFDCIELYFIHDLHKGSHLHDKKKWETVKREILSEPWRYVLFLGDAMENVIPDSKGDIFLQTLSPQEQKEWFAGELTDLKDRTIGVEDGNHDRRVAKKAGFYPLYDCCVLAGIKDRYRPHFMFADIGVGRRGKDPKQQVRYVGYCVHKAKDMKNFSTADAVDGIDFFAYGHDHDPKDHPRAKLVYDTTRKIVTQKSIETINAGSFLAYGGYAADEAYRPLSDKVYKLILSGGKKNIQSVGFYV